MKTTLRLRSVSVAHSMGRTTKSIRIPKKIGTSRSLSRLIRGSALLTLLTLLTFNCFANNVVISNTTLNGNALRFKITWENSWRITSPPYNWDAVWVFVKYAECGGTTQVWQHASLSPLPADNALPDRDSSDVKLLILPSLQANDTCKGVYIVRNPNNTGGPGDANIPAAASTPASSVVKLILNIPSGTYNFKVFGIEMVYVPSNNFYAGDNKSLSAFSNVAVTSTHETVDNTLTGAALGGASSNIPAAYPVGWQSFYSMKYEISQEEYVDFLNTLTYDQQTSRTNAATPPNSVALTHALTGVATGGTKLNRNGIMILSPGNAGTSPKTPAIYGCNLNEGGLGPNTCNQSDDGQNVACNYLSWADLTAYLDWACLRPMSEMEYEKVCKGITASNGMERPWGSASNTVSTACAYCLCCQTNIAGPEYSTASCPGNGEPYYAYSAACVYTGISSAECTIGLTAATSAALTNRGYSSEVSTSTGNGLCAVGNAGNTATDGPLRVGFAATGSTNRVTAGAGYYGVMDLAGNVWERTVSTDATGVTLNQDSLGNGVLATNGNPDVGTWPAPATATGSGYRGGAWNSQWLYSCGAGNDITPTATWYFFTNYPLARTSNRRYATTADATRRKDFGGRGVRKGKGVNN